MAAEIDSILFPGCDPDSQPLLSTASKQQSSVAPSNSACASLSLDTAANAATVDDRQKIDTKIGADATKIDTATNTATVDDRRTNVVTQDGKQMVAATTDTVTNGATVDDRRKIEFSARPATVDGEGKIRGVVVKQEIAECDGQDSDDDLEGFLSTDGGTGASDSEGDVIRQAWMAAQALLSTGDTSHGASSDLPLEVWEEEEEEGEGVTSGKGEGEAVEVTATSVGGGGGEEERMEDKESDDDGLTTVYNPHQKPVLCVKVGRQTDKTAL